MNRIGRESAISRVSIVQTDREHIDNAMSQLFKFSEIDPKKGSEIVIKPNICNFRQFETGATTDPRVLTSLINLLWRDYSPARITLVESDATNKADILFKWLGFEKLSKELNVNYINLSKDKSVKIKINGYHFSEFNVPKVIHDADFFISFPKLKTHSFAKISCSLKNQFGCIPDHAKFKFHPILDDVIADANQAMKPDFAVVDGLIAMDGIGGPLFGRPVNANLLIAGKDLVAVDSLCARIFKFNPYSVGQISKCARKGLGNIKYAVNTNKPDWILPRLDFDNYGALLLKGFGWLKELRN